MQKNLDIYDVIAENVKFSYATDDGNGNVTYRKALDGLDVAIKKGSYTAILGPNGSGKSTLAKLIDILEVPNEGKVVVFGKDTTDQDGFWDIREKCSCVFQNPDNQIVGTIVEEDVAFGPENLGIKLPELRERVDKALEYVGLTDLRDRPAASLSGGQKQKLAVAGCLAMQPDILIMDESTSMLDPVSRDELLNIVEDLNRTRGITVITITHDMTEASRCDMVYVIEDGKVSMSGTPAEVFSDPGKIHDSFLSLPVHIALTEMIASLCDKVITPEDIESEEACLDTIVKALNDFSGESQEVNLHTPKPHNDEKLMSIKGLSHTYDDGKTYALDNIDLDIYKGEILAIVGKSGCGKTTLISHLNGIIKPQSGDITIDTGKKTLSVSNKKDIPEIRKNVGLVFQYPEYQLFEDTVRKDVAFGLKKSGLTDYEKDKRVVNAIKRVGLKEDILDKNPFELSGGQKRRVAMAGVLVMEPKVLVLDEPAAGLDPRGRHKMFTIINDLRSHGTTIILVSHNMDEAFANADRLCCIRDGKIMACDTPEKLFEDPATAKEIGIDRPLLHSFSDKVRARLIKDHPTLRFGPVRRTPELEALSIVSDFLRNRRSGKHAE